MRSGAASGGCRSKVRPGSHRPPARRPGPPSHRAPASRARRTVRHCPLHDFPRHRRDRPTAGGARFRRPDRPGVRLRPVADVFAYAEAGGQAADRRRRNPGPPASGQPARTTNLRLQQDEADHHRNHHPQRRPGTPAVEVDEGHPGPANKSPDQVSARRKSEGQRPAQRATHPAGNATTAALQADLRRAHQRQAAALAPTPALHQSPRELHRDPLGNRLTDLGPLRPPTNPPQAEHRIGARLADGLLINHQPTRQTNTPRPQSQTESSEQTR